jgi:NDP-sugar pyrophosphorylase family protein
MAGPHLTDSAQPWTILPTIGEIIAKIARGLPKDYREIADEVWVGPETIVAPTAAIWGPAIIGARCEIRPSAFFRGRVLVGDDCVVGNSTELKNVILFDHVQVPHFNYAGDSILGYRVHLGAGAILSNVRLDGQEVSVRHEDEMTPTGLRKFGALLGDGVEIGCNAVINPGTIIGRESLVLPLANVGGVIPPMSIVRGRGSPLLPKR